MKPVLALGSISLLPGPVAAQAPQSAGIYRKGQPPLLRPPAMQMGPSVTLGTPLTGRPHSGSDGDIPR